MKAVIAATGIISPQHTHDATDFPAHVETFMTNRLTCMEPDYRNLINPMLLRRMPRILKMGLASSQLCINRSGNLVPDAIIVGTGLGCLNNLEQFLTEMLNNNEHITSVLPFIHSTHNAVASQVAMMLKNHNYNMTYCHRGFSFESALQDALMQIEEKQAEHVLVGGIDECTSDFMHLHGYLDYWKPPVDSLGLLENKNPGTIAGEGSSFFMLSGRSGNNNDPVLCGVYTFLTPADAPAERIESEIENFLQDMGITKENLDLVLLGMNGDFPFDAIYRRLRKSFFTAGTGCAVYKPLCGEFYTSSAFALWLASVIIRRQTIPHPVCISPATGNRIQNILVYNHLRNVEHSLMLVAAENMQ
jgi:3-oxoacyl-[acyl-carrier-protein] synthase II